MISVRNNIKFSRSYLSNLLLITMCIKLQSCMVLSEQPDQVSSQEAVTQEINQPSSGSSSSFGVNQIPVISSAESFEQEAIIAEINRDGRPLIYPGLEAPVPAPTDAEGPDIVELNYEQADLRMVLEQLADALDISILIDPSIDDRISIRTSPERPLQRDDIWPLMRLLTRDAGIFLERVGDIYNARRVSSRLPADIVGPDSPIEAGSAQVMQITPLTFVSTEAAIQAIGPLLEPEGSVSQLGSRDLLIITASDFLLQRANELLTLIDSDPFTNQGIHLYQLSNANAAEVAEMKDVAENQSKVLMFDFNNRARPESYALMDYINSGDVGMINSAQAKWIRRTGIPGFGGWFTNKKLSGGGPVIDLLHMLDLALFYMGYPDPQHVLAQTFNDFIENKSFKGPWGIPDVADGVTDVESAAHGFIRFTTGQVLSYQVSWAEMNKREEVSVTFQGQKAGGMSRRLFNVDGLDETSIDDCELYVQENGRSVNRSIITEPNEDMGRIRAAQNFVLTIEGDEKPLNTPDQALKLMKIIDATYESASSGRPVVIS